MAKDRDAFEIVKYDQATDDDPYRYFSGRAATSVTGADVAKHADLRLTEKAATATVNRELSALRRAYRLAVEQTVLVTMPKIGMLREDNVRGGFLDVDQVEAVCRHLTEETAAAVRFAFITAGGPAQKSPAPLVTGRSQGRLRSP